MSKYSYASYSEVDETIANALLEFVDKKVNDEDTPVNVQPIQDALNKIFLLIKEEKIAPDQRIGGIPFFYILLNYEHYDNMASEYHQLFKDEIPNGNFDGNIFHYLASGRPELTDQGFRMELLDSYADDPDWKICLTDDKGHTPAMTALELKDFNYLNQLSERDLLCKSSKDKNEKTIIEHLKANHPDLLRNLFPEIWLSRMVKKHHKFANNIKKKHLETNNHISGTKRKLEHLNFKLPQVHEASAHYTKKPKKGECCYICGHDLKKKRQQVVSKLCGEDCDKMVCLQCAGLWKQQCIKGEQLHCSCYQGEDKKFLRDSTLAAFGANNNDVFDVYVRRMRSHLGELEGFTPCITPDCNGGTIIGPKEKMWHKCELCGKESHLMGKEVLQDNEEIPKPWERPRPCPYCNKAYYEVTEACDHITCETCKNDFNVVYGRTSRTTYEYNHDDPYKSIRRYRIPGDLDKNGDPYEEYQDGIEPEEDLDLEALEEIGFSKSNDS